MKAAMYARCSAEQQETEYQVMVLVQYCENATGK
jgi:hypothetical protein